MFYKIFSFTLMVLLTGCLTYSTDDGTADSTSAQANKIPPAENSRMLLTGCQNSGGVRIDTLASQVKAEAPPGWQARNPTLNRISLYVLFCAHISWAEFERGPVSLVVESHADFDAPEACRDGDYTFLNILGRVVIDDNDLAHAFSTRMGMPVSFGKIDRLEGFAYGGANLTKYSWSIVGNESWFDLGKVANEVVPAPRTYRLVWEQEGTLWRIDLALDARQTTVEPTGATGSFSEPMLLARTGAPVVFGTGVIDDETFPQGTFEHFGDLTCEQRLP